mgnify:CR=1 FL=1
MAKHVGVDTVRGAQALYVANLMVKPTTLTSFGLPVAKLTAFVVLRFHVPGQVNIATEDPETWAVAREAGREFLAQANGDSAFDLYAVGHCHIDTGTLHGTTEPSPKVSIPE